MASDTWFTNLEAKIFTIIKTRATRNLVSTYPNIFFTRSSQTDGDPVFPTVYIHELPGLEMGMDLDNTGINAILETVQVEVTTNQSMQDCTKVMQEVMTQFKAIRFSFTALPTYIIEDGGVYRGIVRARRLIGSDDSLL